MISIQNLSVRQGAFALSGVSLAVPRGQYAVLMGRSGSGKTTVLEAIAGLRKVRSGSITLAGSDVTALAPAARHVGYVPQGGVLFSTMTVRENIGFALRVRGDARAEVAARVGELAEQLEVAHLLDRGPQFLSGGERHRVALGRALASRPPVLLLDEPLASLDDDTRAHLVALLARLRDARDTTVLHVTHDRAEAERLGDLAFRIEAGAVHAGSAGGV
ncbi:MAG: ABC transporter ATP-binding protein [Gemmata sp.]